MHNIKDIRKNPEQFQKDLNNRSVSIDLKKILSLDESNRKLIQLKENLESINIYENVDLKIINNI